MFKIYFVDFRLILLFLYPVTEIRIRFSAADGIKITAVLLRLPLFIQNSIFPLKSSMMKLNTVFIKSMNDSKTLFAEGS